MRVGQVVSYSSEGMRNDRGDMSGEREEDGGGVVEGVRRTRSKDM